MNTPQRPEGNSTIEVNQNSILSINSNLTLQQFMVELANTLHWVWIADWWPTNNPTTVLVSNGDKTWDAKDANAVCPNNIQGLGWNGSDTTGRLIWIGWDLDVGHGREQYETRDHALSDAFLIRGFLKGQAEIRLSKSGEGVHVRHKLPDSENRPSTDGPFIAKTIAEKLKLKADRSALGRQTFWFWTLKTFSDSFRLIFPHEGMEE